MNNTVDLSEICSFCSEIVGHSHHNLYSSAGFVPDERRYVLAETENFAVIPCVGAFTDWYLLVVTKAHVLSFGYVERSQQPELEMLIDRCSDWLRRQSGLHRHVGFEHGSYSFRDKGGACYDHAHLHLVATGNTASAFMDHLSEVKLEPVVEWLDAARSAIGEDRRSYLAVWDEGEVAFGDSSGASTQFFRRALARWLGLGEERADYALFPEHERLHAMVAAAVDDPI